MKLTDSKIKALKPKDKPYQAPDGNGLVLEIKPTGRKIWVMRYRVKGKAKKTMLGFTPTRRCNCASSTKSATR